MDRNHKMNPPRTAHSQAWRTRTLVILAIPEKPLYAGNSIINNRNDGEDDGFYGERAGC